MKRKGSKSLLLFGTSALACVALVGVGFASWVITADEQKADATITVSVAEVVDHRLSMTASIDENNNSVWFDADSEDNSGNVVFSSNSSGLPQGEDLTFGLTYVVKAVEGNDVTSIIDPDKTVTAYMTLTDSDGNVVNVGTSSSPWNTNEIQIPLSADSSNPDTILTYSNSAFSGTAFYTNPPSINKYSSTATLSSSDNSSHNNVLTVNVTFSFAWGEVFNYENPSHESWEGDSSSSKAMSALTTNLEKYNNISFTVHLEVNTK